MNINVINYKELKDRKTKHETIKNIVDWQVDFNKEVEETVANIIYQVKSLGNVSLLDYTRKFDGNDVNTIDSILISNKVMLDAWETITKEQRKSLQLASNRIKVYAEKQKIESWDINESDGSIMGQKVSALDSVGLYVPGGTAAYPSSVLMSATPAKVAGVKRLVIVSPATKGKLNKLVLAAAYLCGVDEFYTIGGAQAIAALTYGTETIEPVDKIVGPGNIYVTTAKKQVFGKVAIDMIAGPSEVAIISDGSSLASWVAADLFAQAEHDPNAQSILITSDENHANEVLAAMDVIIKEMPRANIISESISNRGALILTNSLEQSIEVVNLIAPEHLEILTKEPEDIVERIKHAGAIFVGEYSCEVLGDYIAGPNHVLPTSGTARFSSPLGVYDFQKRSSIIYCTKGKSNNLASHAKLLAESEGLYAHALSADYRIKK